jgi:hypothetical protein
VLRAGLFDLKPGVIDAVRASSLGDLFRPGSNVNQNAGAGSWAKGHDTKAGQNFLISPCGIAAFVVNQEPHTGRVPRFGSVGIVSKFTPFFFCRDFFYLSFIDL